MIHDEIRDTMNEVSASIQSLPDGSEAQTVMYQVHAALSLAHSLVCIANSMQLARLMNQDGG